MTKFDIYLYKITKWLFIIAIGVIVFLLTGCSKDKPNKNQTYQIAVTGNSFNSQWTVNGQTYYGGNPPTLTIRSGESATYYDGGVNTQKNVSVIVDNNTVWSYNGTGLASYTYTAK